MNKKACAAWALELLKLALGSYAGWILSYCTMLIFPFYHVLFIALIAILTGFTVFALKRKNVTRLLLVGVLLGYCAGFVFILWVDSNFSTQQIDVNRSEFSNVAVQYILYGKVKE